MTQRVSQQPAWVLHRRPYRDSSVLLDLFTPDHGQLSLVGRGQRAGRQGGQLQPLRPLRVDFVRRGELGTLGRFEAAGPAVDLSGTPLWSAFYINELVLRLTRPEDAQATTLFAHYSQALRALQTRPPAVVLRRFEYQLLCHLGYALDPDSVAPGATAVSWDPARGLVASTRGVPVAALWALLAGADDEAILDARDLLAAMLNAQLGGRPLHSARMLRELVALRRGGAAPGTQNR